MITCLILILEMNLFRWHVIILILLLTSIHAKQALVWVQIKLITVFNCRILLYLQMFLTTALIVRSNFAQGKCATLSWILLHHCLLVVIILLILSWILISHTLSTRWYVLYTYVIVVLAEGGALVPLLLILI